MKYLINMIGKNRPQNKRAVKVNIITALLILQTLDILGQSKSQNELSNPRVIVQANEMGNAFLKEDYKIFAKYTYPAMLNSMGGESRMATALANNANSMKMQGMIFDNITFDKPSKIIKNDNELQCTLQQHTTIKLPSGRAVATSTLIAISKDGGKNWLFVDTSGKDAATMKKALPNLSAYIIIPPQQKPVFYKF